LPKKPVDSLYNFTGRHFWIPQIFKNVVHDQLRK
jgi:hypothetical protein